MVQMYQLLILKVAQHSCVVQPSHVKKHSKEVVNKVTRLNANRKKDIKKKDSKKKRSKKLSHVFISVFSVYCNMNISTSLK